MYLTRNLVAWAVLLTILYVGSTSAGTPSSSSTAVGSTNPEDDPNCTPLPMIPLCPPEKSRKCKLCPKKNMNFMRICTKHGKGCLSCPKKYKCVVPKKKPGQKKNRKFGFCCKGWKKLTKKQRRKTKKRNFAKIDKAKRQVKRLIGKKKWHKLPKKLRGILIQLKLCKKNLKKFNKMFKRMWKLFFKGASGKRIGRVLKRSKWGKKNVKVAKKMAKCLKRIKGKKRSKRSKMCPRKMKFVRVCKEGGCLRCPEKFKCVTPKKGWGFCFRKKAWKALSKKKKKAIKKKNFKKLEKAKKQVKKAIGADWPKIPRYFRQALIQFKVCVKNMKKYKKKFSFMWEMLLKGKPGKKIANKLKKTKWGKKHKGAAKQISKCLKKRIP